LRSVWIGGDSPRIGAPDTAGCGEDFMIDQEFAAHFAADWIAAWNSHDLQRILEQYSHYF
jgi:hypothetical protein